MSGSDIYPSIHWFPHNPVFQFGGFQADGSECGHGPRELTVQLQSKITFVCPNTATVLQASSDAVLPAEMFENLWLVYNKTAFNECDVTLDPNKRRILTCNEPLKLTYSLVKFEENTAELNGITFNGGQTYYFIATSDGTQSGINNTSGGRCRNNNMKIEVYVCKRSNVTYQDPKCATRVGKLRCPPVTSGAPTPSTVSPTPSTEGISATRSIHPSASVTPSETVCVQTVITKTVSSEVTASVSCPDVCDNYVSSADLSTMTLSSAVLATNTMTTPAEIATGTGTSAGVPTETVQPLTSFATEPTHSTIVPSESLPFAVTFTSKHTPLKILSSEPINSSVFPSITMPFSVMPTTKEEVSHALTFTETVMFTDPTRSSRPSVSPTEDNGSIAPQQPQNARLSGSQDDCSGKETWQAIAVLFIVLFCVATVFAVIPFIKYRKTYFSSFRHRVSPTEMGPSEEPVDGQS